jgi:hypothetical protein
VNHRRPSGLSEAAARVRYAALISISATCASCGAAQHRYNWASRPVGVHISWIWGWLLLSDFVIFVIICESVFFFSESDIMICITNYQLFLQQPKPAFTDAQFV